MLYGLFFIIGLLSEYSYARWTVTIVQNKLSSLFWAFSWAGLNVLFVLELVERQDYINGLAWALGIVVGSGFSLLRGVK